MRSTTSRCTFSRITSGSARGELCKQFYLYNHNRDTLEAAHAGKKAIAIVDARDIGLANVDIGMYEDCFRLNDQHFPCLYFKMGLFGIPWLLIPIADFIIKYCMPAGFRARLKVYGLENISEIMDQEHLPLECGGKLVMKPLLDVTGHELKTIRDHGKEWGLEGWEIQKIEATIPNRSLPGRSFSLP